MLWTPAEHLVSYIGKDTWYKILGILYWPVRFLVGHRTWDSRDLEKRTVQQVPDRGSGQITLSIKLMAKEINNSKGFYFPP